MEFINILVEDMVSYAIFANCKRTLFDTLRYFYFVL